MEEEGGSREDGEKLIEYVEGRRKDSKRWRKKEKVERREKSLLNILESEGG